MFLNDSNDEIGGAKENYVTRGREPRDISRPLRKSLGSILNHSERHQFVFCDRRSTLRYAYDSSIIDERELMVR